MDDKVKRGAYLSRHRPFGFAIVKAADAAGRVERMLKLHPEEMATIAEMQTLLFGDTSL